MRITDNIETAEYFLCQLCFDPIDATKARYWKSDKKLVPICEKCREILSKNREKTIDINEKKCKHE